MTFLSIVIPTLNEADSLPVVLGRVRRTAGQVPLEIVVADCNSRDGTPQVARDLGASVVSPCRNRGHACNRGASATRGDCLLFLHADTELPPEFATAIARAMRNPQVVGGAFDFMFHPHEAGDVLNHRLLQFVAICNRVRFRRSRGFFGDQGIFVRRSVFDRVGGFPDVPLLEDLRFSLAMSRLGATAILPSISTSPRRFTSRGVLQQFFMDLHLLARESFSLESLAACKRYNGWNHDRSPAPRPVVGDLCQSVPS